jgi:hypothetical protein
MLRAIEPHQPVKIRQNRQASAVSAGGNALHCPRDEGLVEVSIAETRPENLLGILFGVLVDRHG